MEVNKKTKLFAQFADHNYGNGRTEEVVDLQAAVDLALELRSPRFSTFEKSSALIDGEVLQGQPKNHSANIYVGLDQIFSLDDVIKSHERELAQLENDQLLNNAEMTRHFAIEALEGVIASISAKDPSTLFIAEGGQRSGFIELNEGEQVFNSNGMQIFPHPTGGLAPEEDAPASQEVPEL